MSIIIKLLLSARMGGIMIRKNWIAMALMLALFGCGAFLALPIWGVSEALAQPQPLPTYNRSDNPFPSSEFVIPPDIANFRPVQLIVRLKVSENEINAILNQVGMTVRLFPWNDPGEATIFASWVYRSIVQYPNLDSTHPGIDPSVTYGPGNLFALWVYAYDSYPSNIIRLISLADVRPSNEAVDRRNAVMGEGVSRAGEVEIAFESENKVGEDGDLKIKASVIEPTSGLEFWVNAKFPEGLESFRVVQDPFTAHVAYMDLSTPIPTMGPVFRLSRQFDRNFFDLNSTPEFEIEMPTPHTLSLPGNRTIDVLGFEQLQTLQFRSNAEFFGKFKVYKTSLEIWGVNEKVPMDGDWGTCFGPGADYLPGGPTTTDTMEVFSFDGSEFRYHVFEYTSEDKSCSGVETELPAEYISGTITVDGEKTVAWSDGDEIFSGPNELPNTPTVSTLTIDAGAAGTFRHIFYIDERTEPWEMYRPKDEPSPACDRDVNGYQSCLMIEVQDIIIKQSS